jgi:hypothetical protein
VHCYKGRRAILGLRADAALRKSSNTGRSFRHSRLEVLWQESGFLTKSEFSGGLSFPICAFSDLLDFSNVFLRFTIFNYQSFPTLYVHTFLMFLLLFGLRNMIFRLPYCDFMQFFNAFQPPKTLFRGKEMCPSVKRLGTNYYNIFDIPFSAA